MKHLEHSKSGDTTAIPPGAADRPRYAIYYTPASEHPLTVAARTWLGRDAFAPGMAIAATDAPAFTSEPRRYGFHATVKAPFRLRESISVEALERGLRGFAAKTLACPIGRLRIDRFGGFFALIPAEPLPSLRGFASRVVEEFDAFRAPTDGDDLKRRMKRSLDDVEMTNLVTWGYPYVGDRFRFHMTLTDRVPEDQRAAMQARLEDVFQPYLAEDFHIDALSLFVQEHRGADFVVRSQFALRTGAALKAAV